MNVSLTPELEKFISERVESGQYRSASEVVREGLRLLIRNDELRHERLKSLHRDIQIGLDELDAGLSIDGQGVIEEVRDLSRARRNG